MDSHCRRSEPGWSRLMLDTSPAPAPIRMRSRRSMAGHSSLQEAHVVDAPAGHIVLAGD